MYEQIREKIKGVKDSFVLITEKAKGIFDSSQIKDLKFIDSAALIDIKNDKKTFSVGAVDSGFFSDSFVGFDFCFVKISGSVFYYKNGKLEENKRFPKNPLAVFFTPDACLQKEEFERYVSITRIKQELLLARQIIETNDLDYFLLDGSLIPHPMDRLKKDSEIYKEYQELISSYLTLYVAAEKKKTRLIGCVEDSRSNFFTKKFGLEKFNDSIFLNAALNKKQGVNFFRAGEENKILDDLNAHKKVDLYVGYVKVNDYDLPLRIEMIDPCKEAIEVIYFLASHTKNYSYPSVIIDADLRAKLSPNEINTVKAYIEGISNIQGIKKLRRNRRPF
ncbi:MAG: DNA double-strand break repair nuclease NurA [Candidatus ainarchaeum sp.]|nr:DNA double-strand break repair nuclease NurA [Candidatus ainarchaeum sp.]